MLRVFLTATLVLASSGAAVAAQSARALFETAQATETRLRESNSRSPAAWTAAGQAYRAVVISFPRSGYCDDALWYAGGVYRDAAGRFGDRSFAVRGLDAYRLLTTGYPTSKWVPKAFQEQVRLLAGRLDDRDGARRTLAMLRELRPDAPETRMASAILEPARSPRRSARPSAPAPETPAAPSGPPATVENIRHWVGESHTRVVVDMSRRTAMKEGRLSNPDRVFFDLEGAEMDGSLGRREFPIQGSHLRRIRLGAPEEGVVRVVLDFSSVQEVTSFWLPDPYRLVVDIHGAPLATVVAEAGGASEGEASPEGEPEPPPAAPAAPGEPTTAEPTDSGYSLARQLGLRVRKIVVDPGHGGKDPGTHSGRLREKDIVLDLSRQVRDRLEDMGFEVVMTRDRDVFIPLEQRAFLANNAGADLFVSIHVNAARSRRARGLETFYLNLATSEDAAEVAARENASNDGLRVSDLPDLVDRILNHERKEESRAFAEAMQGSLAEKILGRSNHPHNRGVKSAGFHVLLGAQMAAILVETGFVTNSAEAKLLGQKEHRAKLADAIADGVARYARQLGQSDLTTAQDPGR